MKFNHKKEASFLHADIFWGRNHQFSLLNHIKNTMHLSFYQIWYFKRLDMPNYLEGALLAAYSENRDMNVSIIEVHVQH